MRIFYDYLLFAVCVDIINQKFSADISTLLESITIPKKKPFKFSDGILLFIYFRKQQTYIGEVVWNIKILF